MKKSQDAMDAFMNAWAAYTKIRRDDRMIHGQGVVEQQGNGGNRESRKNRGRFDLITYEAAHALAVWCELGAEKYGDRNWENGLSVKDTISRMVGHAIKASNGWTDEDHLAAVMWNAMCAITMEKRKYMDEFRDHPWRGPHGEPVVHDEEGSLLKEENIDYSNINHTYKARDLDSKYLEMKNGIVLIKKPYQDYYMYFSDVNSDFWNKYKKSLDLYDQHDPRPTANLVEDEVNVLCTYSMKHPDKELPSCTNNITYTKCHTCCFCRLEPKHKEETKRLTIDREGIRVENIKDGALDSQATRKLNCMFGGKGCDDFDRECTTCEYHIQNEGKSPVKEVWRGYDADVFYEVLYNGTIIKNTPETVEYKKEYVIEPEFEIIKENAYKVGEEYIENTIDNTLDEKAIRKLNCTLCNCIDETALCVNCKYYAPNKGKYHAPNNEN